MLAQFLRPTSLDHFVGQQHLVGDNKPVRNLIESKQIFSMLLWGPPGVGKTTLARIIALASNRKFIELSAVAASKADVRAIVEEAQNKQKSLLETYQAPVLFLDEIHRFNKAQQDFLLPYVEQGTIYLIGATTENPSFEVIAPLLSRVRVFVLKPLELEDLQALVKKVANSLQQKISTSAANLAIEIANGDARSLLTLLDHCQQTYEKITLNNLKSLGTSWIRHDKSGDGHYDTISALIKSLRASQVDAALYYLARLIKAGEDPKFIARRLIIFASEDIGLAQPTALVVANAVFEAVHKIGLPEAQINLAQAVAYLAQAKKDRRAYDAYFAALADVEKYGNLEIPIKIRNAPTKLMKQLNYGQGYQMYGDSDLLPEKIKNHKYFKDQK